MKQFIAEVQPILPFLLNLLWWAVIVWKFKDVMAFITGMLSDNGRLSSRRGVAMGSAWTLFYLCINCYKDINQGILWLLVVLIVLCLSLATLPEIMKIVQSIQGLVSGTPASNPKPIDEAEPSTPSQEQ